MRKSSGWPLTLLMTVLALLWQGESARAMPVASADSYPLPGTAGAGNSGLGLWEIMNSWAGASAAFEIGAGSASVAAQVPVTGACESSLPEPLVQPVRVPQWLVFEGLFGGGCSTGTNSTLSVNSVVTLQVAPVPAAPSASLSFLGFVGSGRQPFLPRPYLLGLFRPPRASW